MAGHVMTAEATLEIVAAVDARGADVTVGGGWAVDALLARQTREHSDLDLWVSVDSFESLIAALVDLRLDRLLPWPGDRPWNFVVHDGHARRVDLHTYEHVESEFAHYGPASGGDTFPLGVLDGRGTIAGTSVRCETVEWALECHTGYSPRDVDRHDVRLLCNDFGLEPPPAYV